MSTNLIAGEDVHFDYSQKETQQRKRKMQVQINDPNAEYPASRVIKQGANGDVIVSPMDSNEQQQIHQKGQQLHPQQQFQPPPHQYNEEEYDDDDYEEQEHERCCHHHCNHDHDHNEDYDYDEDEDEECYGDEDDDHYHCPHHHHNRKQRHQSNSNSVLGSVEQQSEVIRHQARKPVFGNYLWDSDTPADEQAKIKQFWVGLFVGIGNSRLNES
ncbi:unnamed protein product [Ambrosiozyma monospora]|uniref:Unnamed protein product n=1 Tax=Ambrosiozyma monospora TaxID=43982 RepID=A0ACB5T386_AMBMO|nr:unnamed protein product [Ambrosiozyma monospora]